MQKFGTEEKGENMRCFYSFFCLFFILNGKPIKEKVSAPTPYSHLMLIITNNKGIAFVIFENEIYDLPPGKIGVYKFLVHYRFRFFPKGKGKPIEGKGKVLEYYETKKEQNKILVFDKGSQNIINAGEIKLEWSYYQPGWGWIYYYPEEMQVQIATKNDFFKLDPKRFFKNEKKRERR